MAGRKVACFISLPNLLTYQFEIRPDDTGNVCLDKICGALAIVEKDYFGLQYKHKGYRYWLNLRNDINRQIKSPPPYRFQLRVKYFIGPEHIQQESTRVIFYIHLRNAITNGEFHIPFEKQPYIGALMAHIEDGPPPTNVPTMMYPCFFPNCEIGVSRRIAIEHQSLAGLTRSSAEALFLTELCHMEGYGCHRYPAKSEKNEDVILSIGGNSLSVLTLQGRSIHRIPYSALLEAAYKDKYFTVRYRTVNESEENSTTSYSVKTASHKLALSMFRMLTEDHTFFYHERVGERVLNHRMAMSWKELMRKTFLPGSVIKNRHHFDIVRTKMEAYSQAWEILHQLQGTGPTVSSSSSSSDQGQPHRIPPTLRAITIDSSNASDAASSFNFRQQEDELDGYLRIGLSRSSTVLAKEILEKTGEIGGTTLQGKHSRSTGKLDDALEVDKIPSTTSLNVRVGGKFRQFLRKIEDSRLCKVCYDNEVAVVFCPCGHHVCCQRCAEICHVCPICRKHIAHIQLVFSI